MRVVSWIFRTVLFLAALGFALSNTAVTELRFFGVEFVWRAPLVIFLLAFLAAGVLLGLLGLLPTWYRMRREIGRLRRELRVAEKAANAASPRVAPPDVPRRPATVETLPAPGP